VLQGSATRDAILEHSFYCPKLVILTRHPTNNVTDYSNISETEQVGNNLDMDIFFTIRFRWPKKPPLSHHAELYNL